MSNKNGASAQPISLPKGGGALQGIGEKFTPDLHTGTGNFSVPIALPAGRNGFQPQLSLGYSTGNGNGPFGIGWTLNIPGVSRKTSHGVPRYDDATDTFILSGAEDLVAVPDSQSRATRYRPRTEGLFARIWHVRDDANDYWKVESKDGLVSHYGTPRPADDPSWRDAATVADPAAPARIFAWKLTRTTDPFGNRIEYRYRKDVDQVDGPHRWDQVYLDQIRYVDYGDPDAPQFLVTVSFDYEARPDPFSDYRAGFDVRTVLRCTTIRIETHAGTTTPARSYHLDYLDQRPDAIDEPPLNGSSLLSRVRVEGHAGDQSEWLPPLEFRYTGFEPDRRHLTSITGDDLPTGWLAHPDYELVDLIGNGLPDVLEMNGTVRYWRNEGGRFAPGREMRAGPAGFRLADRGVQLVDADGDGRTDLLVSTASLTGYFPLRFGGLWDERSFQRYRVAPTFDLDDPEVRLVDLDGDGITDAIRSGTHLECFFNGRDQGWDRVRVVERRALDAFPNVPFSDPHVKWADMTGDGLQDVVLVHDGAIEYWPALGHGNWAPRVTMRACPRFPEGYDSRRILLGDVDGDGAADLIYVDDARVTLWINRGGNAWSAPITIDGTPPVTDMDGIRLVDLHGNGIPGIVWSPDAAGATRGGLFFLDLAGGHKPYLLCEIDGHMGAVTRVEYASSTRFYLEDERCPETRWRTPLPFPVHVVARVEVVDALSRGKLTTEYRYHHGYWDGAEREFRGFGRVDQLDTEVFADYHASGLHGEGADFLPVPTRAFSPPTETRSWFHQGPVGDEYGDWSEPDYSTEYWAGDLPALSRPPEMTRWLNNLPRRARRDALRVLRGNVLRTELYARDGTERADRPYTVTEHLVGVMPVPIGEFWRDAPEPWQLKVFFPHLLAQRSTEWERGDDPMTRVEFTSAYDAYGQPRAQTTIAVPRGRAYRTDAPAGQPYFATRTETLYAQPPSPGSFIADRVARTTSFEIVNDGSPSLLAFYEAIERGRLPTPPKVINQTLNFYDGVPFQGLPFGQVGQYGALVRTESLILTPDILAQAYGTGAGAAPPYLTAQGAPVWTNDYPPEFRSLLPAGAGYVYQPGGAGAPHAQGWFAMTERRRYDVQGPPAGSGRGLLRETRDLLDNPTGTDYDPYGLLPVAVTDPAGLTTTAAYDYRVLQPREVTDPNGNRTRYTFTPLGLLASIAVMGKTGEAVGDTDAMPGARFTYDLLAFDDRGQPASVRTTQRVHHATDGAVPATERDETITTVEYSDGFGRLLQTRGQAEDVVFAGAGACDPLLGDAGLPREQTTGAGKAVGQQPAAAGTRVVVSGWQIYDNKGRVVEKYEPFFANGLAYTMPTPAELQCLQKVTTSYDPRGQVVRVVNPDGSEQRMVRGVPPGVTAPRLIDPDSFAPTPWQVYTYDTNDNAGRTHPNQAVADPSHWNTPSSATTDAAGRTVETVERNGPNPATDWYTRRSEYDSRGNVLQVTDALGRVVLRSVYDLANRPLRTEGLDAGVRRTVVDAAGNAIEQRDARGALVLRAHDLLGRPVRLWARTVGTLPPVLRELIEFGDGGTPDQPAAERTAARAANLLGRARRQYDEAGLLACDRYDFKGNLVEKTRQVIKDDEILAVYPQAASNQWRVAAYGVNWRAPSGVTLAQHATALLDPARYETTSTYDALNRVVSVQYPRNASGQRTLLRARYNRAGALERVELDGAVYVERIAYNARGQRLLIAYGNGLMTRYAYDPRSGRLARLRTEAFTQQAGPTYLPHGAALQDYAYTYDLAGNLTRLADRTPGSGVPAVPDRLDRNFVYDPLYRLRSATGRECDSPPPPPPWADLPRCRDVTRARAYQELYDYDPAGNLTRLRHQGTGGFTRVYTLASGDRLATLEVGTDTFAYAYDAAGNLVQEGASRFLEWDHNDRLRTFRTQTRAPGSSSQDNRWSEPSVHVHYLYGAAGQRVKKLVRKQGGAVEVTVSIDGVFEHRSSRQPTGTVANTVVHVLDGTKRIAQVRTGPALPGEVRPAVTYELGDHLGGSNVVVDQTGGVVDREEYTPYGDTSFGSFGKKRYRSTGKERDEESGLYYHGARYYAPWLGRWASLDPAGVVDGLNRYAYVRANPLRFVDPSGTQGEDWAKDFENMSGAERGAHMEQARLQQHIEKYGTPEEKMRAKVDGVKVAPAAPLPRYYSDADRELDEAPLIFKLMPGANAGWMIGEFVEGETVSGQRIDRSQHAIDIATELGLEVVDIMSGGGGKTRMVLRSKVATSTRTLTGIEKLDEVMVGTERYVKWKAGLEKKGYTVVERSLKDAAAEIEGRVVTVDPKQFRRIDLMHETRHIRQIQRAEQQGVEMTADVRKWFERGAYEYERRVGKRIGVAQEYLEYTKEQIDFYWNRGMQQAYKRSESFRNYLNGIWK